MAPFDIIALIALIAIIALMALLALIALIGLIALIAQIADISLIVLKASSSLSYTETGVEVQRASAVHHSTILFSIDRCKQAAGGLHVYSHLLIRCQTGGRNWSRGARELGVMDSKVQCCTILSGGHLG